MGFLEQVVRETRRSIEDPAYGTSLARPPERPRPSFRRAIEDDRARGALVVEYKRISPGHRDPVLPPRSMERFVESTASAEPTGYSCLATAPEFEGSPADVAELVARTDRPVLFKDFVVDRRQVEVAARAGASAILLIARLETEGRVVEPLSSLADVAHRLGLEVLLEFHARAELSRVAGVAADVYGVNARNLDTLVIDREAASETLREASARGLRPLLGLSGVAHQSDAVRFWEDGVDGLLVGSAVARAADPAEFLVGLRRPRTRGSQ